MSEAASKSFLNSDVINDEFFIEIVERKLNYPRDQFKLRLVFIAPATGKNENYASVVYRAKISVEIINSNEKKLVDVIIKALISTMEELKEFAIFEREIVMYRDAISSFEDIYLEKTGENVNFGPKCIKILCEPFEVIVLDDLKAEGYEMADRKVGVGIKEAKLIMKKLAKFHAASAIRYQKDKTISPHLDRLTLLDNPKMNSPEQFEKDSRTFRIMYEKMMKSTSSMTGFEKIVEKIQRWDFMRIMSIFMAVAEPMQNGFIVLNHGDDWLNNMMFKYDEKKQLLDAKLIDFQMSFWGSPANDLIYFLVSSVKDEIKIDFYDDLIQYYHEELESSLKKLNYDQPIPTLYELHVDLLQKGGAFSFHMMFVMFIAKYNSNQELDLEQIFNPTKEASKGLDDAFENPIYKASLAKWLPFLDKRGYLDSFLPEAPLTPFMQMLFSKMAPPITPPNEE